MQNTLRCTFIVAVVLILGGFMATRAVAQHSQYASAWTAPAPTWTPAPPDPSPLGPSDPFCIGTSNEGEVWAQFDFPGFGLPGGDTVVGIEVNVNYRSVSTNTTLQLLNNGSFVGSTRPLGATPVGPSTCNDSLIRTAGGSMDLWGTSLTTADFNAGTVSVRLTRTTEPDMPLSLDIESVELVVYLDSDNSDPDCSGAAIADQNADASCQATISGSDVTGVTDPDGDPLTIMVSPTTLSLGANTVTVTADDGNGGTCSEDITVNVIDVTDPVITCPANATLDADDSCQATYTGPAATATDNCDLSPAISSSPSLPALFSGVGDNTITYTATDDEGNDASCDQTVTVQDVTPPVITLNGEAEITLECAIDDYNEAGATATDNCDTDVPVTIGGDTVDADTPGTYTVTYNASDDSGNDADEVERTVDVEDTIAPVINLFEASAGLWPPNHEYHSFTVDGLVESVDEACEEDLGIDDVVIAEATSDEPEEVPDGDGDGATFDDIVFPDCQSVDVRSERQGVSDGRVYGIVLQANDGFNIGESTFGVEVPHEVNGAAVDSGVSYTESNCPPVAPTRMISLDESDAQAEPLQEALAETPTARHADGEAEGLQVATEETPDAFRLHANRPNPFNPETTIRFDVPESAYVRLVVYDLLGRQVRVLVDGTRQAGTHEVRFDGGTLPSGQYLYRLDTPQGSFSGSMLLVK